MKKYKVIIEETISNEFTVKATSPEESAKIAKQKYRDCDFVLSPGNILTKQITP